MKRKALAIVLTLVMLVGVLPMGAFAASYTDTEGHWAETSIERWTGYKVLEGMGDNTYAPDDHLTRAQAMTIFSRLLNLVETADISALTDVAADAWYAPYIEKGYAYDIIKGTSDTTFDPSGSITREQFFSIFARATGIPSASTCDKTFSDLDQVSPWFVEEGTVYSMINRGYLDGYPDGTLQPKGLITRAEVAKVLDNAISDYITEDGSYAISGDGIVVVLAKNVKLTGTFTGHIVSSCVDAVLDLSGLTQPGAKVAVNTAADNVTVNGVAVTNPPYIPDGPYNPNSAPYVYVLQDNTKIVYTSRGGGGGGSPGGKTTTYQVKATIKFDNGKAHGADLATKAYPESSAKKLTLEDVINELCGISGGDFTKNKNQIVNAYTEAYNRLTQDNSGNPATKSWTSDSGYKFDVNGAEGTVAFWNGTIAKTESYLNNFSTTFANVMTDIATDAAVPADAMDEFDAFVAAVDPANLLEAASGNNYKVTAPDAFFDGYWKPAVEAGIKLVDALQTAEYDNYQGLFDSVFAATSKTTCNVDSLKGVGIGDAGFVTDRNYEGGSFSFVSFDNTYTGAVSILDAAEKVLTSSLTDKPSAQAFAKIIDDNGVINLNGELTLDITAVKS